MSVEYFYENDLNMLYNAAVNNSPDGGEQHKKMLELYNNLVAYISHIEHWKSTALQLAKNYGVRIHSLEQRIEELEQERRWIAVSERNPTETGNYFVVCRKEYVGNIRPTIDHFNNEVEKWINTEKFITHWQERPQPPQEEE